MLLFIRVLWEVDFRAELTEATRGPDSSVNKKPFCVFTEEQLQTESSQVYTAVF